jgi:hypothetical protein
MGTSKAMWSPAATALAAVAEPVTAKRYVAAVEAVLATVIVEMMLEVAAGTVYRSVLVSAVKAVRANTLYVLAIYIPIRRNGLIMSS